MTSKILEGPILVAHVKVGDDAKLRSLVDVAMPPQRIYDAYIDQRSKSRRKVRGFERAFMSGTSKESEEYYRRMMVRLAREAGTMIRREEVKRQALTAEVNLNYAESLRKLLEEDREVLSKSWEHTIREVIDRFKKGENMETVISDGLRSVLANLFDISVVRPIPEMARHVERANNFFHSVVNKVVEEIRKEGIYLHLVEQVRVPAEIDVTSVGVCLRDALNGMNMAIGILKGLIDASRS